MYIIQESPAVADKPARRCWNPGTWVIKCSISVTLLTASNHLPLSLHACTFVTCSLNVISFDLIWPFSTYGDILVENHLKTYHLSFGTFLGGDPLRIFRRVIPCQKVKSWGYQVVYISRSCFLLDTISAVTYGRTDTSLSQLRFVLPRYA